MRTKLFIPLLSLLLLGVTLPLLVITTQQRQELRQQATGATTAVTIDLSNSVGTSRFATGASHTQDDISLDSNLSTLASAKRMHSIYEG
jgi:hypothetical protein